MAYRCTKQIYTPEDIYSKTRTELFRQCWVEDPVHPDKKKNEKNVSTTPIVARAIETMTKTLETSVEPANPKHMFGQKQESPPIVSNAIKSLDQIPISMLYKTSGRGQV